jgi:hypothetical protein
MALILIVIYNWKEEDPKKVTLWDKNKIIAEYIQEYLFYEVKLNDCRAFIYVVYTFTRIKYRTAKVSSVYVYRETSRFYFPSEEWKTIIDSTTFLEEKELSSFIFFPNRERILHIMDG